MMIDELKILLALNGNQRLPHLEDEIFADKETTTLYLTNLCKEYQWFKYNDIGNMACLANAYAEHILQSRWIAAECIILTSSGYACNYAIHVVKVRWPAAEEIIKKHKYFYNAYIDYFKINIEAVK